MIEIRQVATDSWLDPRSAKRLSCALADRLWKRCQGHRGLFVTLTYDRSRYDSALQLYRQQSEAQHVALFIRKISRLLDFDLRGKWFCKLEFQKGGWVHWHLIILDIAKIPHQACTELWGRGHVWLRRLSRRSVRYCTKYVCKGAEVPAWLYLERPRSVKIIRVSSGFWGDRARSSPGEDTPPSSGDSDGDALMPCDEYGSRIEGMSVPIGQKLVNNADAFVARDEFGRYRRGSMDLALLLGSLMQRGCGVVGRRGSWLLVDASWSDLGAALEMASGERAAQQHAAAAVHLNRTGNPDAKSVLPVWLDEWFRWLCREECVG